MTLKIYGIGGSRAWRNLWMAEEAGAPYELVETDFHTGASRTPEFLKINPNGSVPALVDGALAMWESLAINLYIAKNYGKALYPRDAADEGRTWQWTLFAATELEKPLALYRMNALVGPPEKRDRAKAEEAWAQLKKPLGVLDGALKERPYLLGAAFTVADLNVSAICYNAWFSKADFSAWPALSAWLERCLTRPAAAKVRKLRE
jgi:glutathione S-transferase